MDGIARIMNTPSGRGVRIVLGLALVGVGAGVVGGTPGGFALMVVGLIPLAMGAWGHCLVEAIPRRHSA